MKTVKGVSIAVLAAAVLSAAACGGSSAKAAKPAATTPGTSSPPQAAASSSSSNAASGSTLTTDQISKLLLTDKDQAGYTFDASQDSTATTNAQDMVSTGGTACQTFVDAQEALSTKYGTTAEIDRQLTKTDGHTIEDSVMTFPSAAKAAAVIADLTTGLKSCKNLTVTQSGGGAVSMEPSAIPELAKTGQAGYVNYLIAGGKTELMAAELVHVGSTVSVVALIGPATTDPAALQQMSGKTLSQLSDVQAGRLKTAQGLG